MERKLNHRGPSFTMGLNPFVGLKCCEMGCEGRAVELGENAERSVVGGGVEEGLWPLPGDAAEPSKAVPGNARGLKRS